MPIGKGTREVCGFASFMEVIIMRIATLFAIFALVGFVASASASTDNYHVKNSSPDGVHYDSGRVEGDTIEEAWVIGGLPFTGFDNTCGFADNYDEVCPYSGSMSGDVVYAYTPGGDEVITIDLCYSLYDTKVFVYEDMWTPGAPFACNDDAHFSAPCYTYSSMIELLNIYAGHTYYIVVDGYGSDCGDYQLDITAEEECVLECPAGAQVEGEPPCIDEYDDQYNGGCNSTGWTLIEAQEGDCGTMCGLSCTYMFQGGSYRDTDWFTMTAVGGDVTATCIAEFPLQFIFFYVIDYNCVAYEYLLDTGGLCEPVTLSYNFTAGQELWLWVGASVFSGVPESDYIIDVCGIEGGVTRANDATWGEIKGMFK